MNKSPNIKASSLGGSRRFCNCFTKLKSEPNKSIQDVVSSVCEDVGGHCTYWRPARNGNWYVPIGFDGDDALDTLAKSIQGRLKTELQIDVNVEPVTNQSSPYGKRVNAASKNSSQIIERLLVSHLHRLNLNGEEAEDPMLKILWSMHKYGQKKKEKEWKEIAVILVLPESEYSEIKGTTELLSDSLLDKYARTAVPSRYVSSLDHCEDEYKLVVHAECKLFGDPKRHPSLVAVPYDRSCLVQLITEYRKSEWLNGRSVDEITKSFKVFLYSENVVCEDCVNAIFNSVFYNLVEKGFCITAEYIPVIGYNFSKGDIDTWRIKERLQFYGPRSTMPGYINRSDSPVAAKRNLNEDLENVPTQARTPVKEGGDGGTPDIPKY